MAEPINLRYETVTPAQGTIGTNLSTATFELFLPSTSSVQDLNRSYFSMSAMLTLSLPDFVLTGIAGVATNMGFFQCPAASLISSMTLMINDQTVSTIDQARTDFVSRKLLSESGEDQWVSGNPLFLAQEDRTILAKSSDGTALAMYGSDHANRRVLSQVVKTANGAAVTPSPGVVALAGPYGVEIVFPMPMLDIEGDNRVIPGNSKIQVEIGFNPGFKNGLLAGVTAAQTTTFSVDRFVWCVPVFSSSIPRGIALSYPFVESRSFRRLNNQSSLTLNVPANTDRVLIYLANTPGATGGFDPNIPINGDITSLSINFSGRGYPAAPYQLTGTVATSDWGRAYNDYVRLSGAFHVGEKAIVGNFASYRIHPVYLFSVRASDNSAGLSTLTVNIQSGNAGDICVFTQHMAQLDLKYDDAGMPVQTSVSLIA